MLGSLQDRFALARARAGTSPVVRFQQKDGMASDSSNIRAAFLVDSCGAVIFGGSAHGLWENTCLTDVPIRQLFGDVNAKALDSALSRRSRKDRQVEELVHLNRSTFNLIATPLQIDHEPHFSVVLVPCSGDATQRNVTAASPLSAVQEDESKEEASEPGKKVLVVQEGDQDLGRSSERSSKSRSKSKTPRARASHPGRMIPSESSLAYSVSNWSFDSDDDVAEKGVQTETEQVSVGCQTESTAAKPPLRPFADRAVDAARATAQALHAEKKRRAQRPLEGVWTILSGHEDKGDDGLLRLHFQRGVVLDNLGTQHPLETSGDGLVVAGFVLSLEGWNVLHLDSETKGGSRLSYTRGEGAYPIGKPVERTRPAGPPASQHKLETGEGTSSLCWSTISPEPQEEGGPQGVLPQRVNSVADLGDITQLLEGLDDLEESLADS